MVLLHHAERRQRFGDRRIHDHGTGRHREDEPAIVRSEKSRPRVLIRAGPTVVHELFGCLRRVRRNSRTSRFLGCLHLRPAGTADTSRFSRLFASAFDRNSRHFAVLSAVCIRGRPEQPTLRGSLGCLLPRPAGTADASWTLGCLRPHPARTADASWSLGCLRMNHKRKSTIHDLIAQFGPVTQSETSTYYRKTRRVQIRITLYFILFY